MANSYNSTKKRYVSWAARMRRTEDKVLRQALDGCNCCYAPVGCIHWTVYSIMWMFGLGTELNMQNTNDWINKFNPGDKSKLRYFEGIYCIICLVWTLLNLVAAWCKLTLPGITKVIPWIFVGMCLASAVMKFGFFRKLVNLIVVFLLEQAFYFFAVHPILRVLALIAAAFVLVVYLVYASSYSVGIYQQGSMPSSSSKSSSGSSSRSFSTSVAGTSRQSGSSSSSQQRNSWNSSNDIYTQEERRREQQRKEDEEYRKQKEIKKIDDELFRLRNENKGLDDMYRRAQKNEVGAIGVDPKANRRKFEDNEKEIRRLEEKKEKLQNGR